MGVIETFTKQLLRHVVSVCRLTFDRSIGFILLLFYLVFCLQSRYGRFKRTSVFDILNPACKIGNVSVPQHKIFQQAFKEDATNSTQVFGCFGRFKHVRWVLKTMHVSGTFQHLETIKTLKKSTQKSMRIQLTPVLSPVKCYIHETTIVIDTLADLFTIKTKWVIHWDWKAHWCPQPFVNATFPHFVWTLHWTFWYQQLTEKH